MRPSQLIAATRNNEKLRTSIFDQIYRQLCVVAALCIIFIGRRYYWRTPLDNHFSKNRKLVKYLLRHRKFLIIAAGLLLYAFYTYDLTGNPPGFYLDESLASYNAHRIYLTGQGEFGHPWPLYFPVLQLPPPHNYLGYADPTQIYALAALYLVFPPSVLLSRMLSATAMFLAAIFLGMLASRISNSQLVGIFVGLTAILTPWLFEVSRLAFGTALYPLAVVLFLSALYSAHRKKSWSIFDNLSLAVTLALLTYTYSIGRLLGPLLAFGLIIFATDRNRFKDVFKTWIAFSVTLLPMLVFHLRNPDALAGRFNMTVGVVTPDKNYWQIFLGFMKNYAENINPRRLLFIGDSNLRHHITDTAPILAVTLILALTGIIFVLVKYRKDPWWRYIVFGLAASVVPASLTRDPFHMLRLIAFPVFLLTLAIPALMWLSNEAADDPAQSETVPRKSMIQSFSAIFAAGWLRIEKAATVPIRRNIGIVLILLTALQAVFFQVDYRRVGPARGLWFDDSYPRVFEAALANPTRPIYFKDGYWGQAYVHGYWYAITKGIDRNSFVHLKQGERPPTGSLVLSSEDKCLNCEILVKEPTYMLYRELGPAGPVVSPAAR